MTTVEPAVVMPMDDVARHVKVLPAAKGPRATAQPARAGTISSPFKLPIALQAAGREVTHADGAGPALVVTQLVVVVDDVVVLLDAEVVVTRVVEEVEVVLLLVDVGVVASEVVDVGVVASEVVEEVETVVLAVVDAGVVLVELLEPPSVDVGAVLLEEHPPLGSLRPMAVCRQDRMFKGSVTAVVRHCAAVPMAKGPRAVVHAATSPGSCAIGAVGMSRQAWGRVVMQTPAMACWRHATMLAPLVVMPMVVARQVAV